MADWVSDSDGSVSFEWDSDDGNGEQAASFNAAGASSSAMAATNIDAPGPSRRKKFSKHMEAGTRIWSQISQVSNGNGKAGPSASLVHKYMEMGFTEEIVRKAIKDNGDNGADSDSLVEQRWHNIENMADL